MDKRINFFLLALILSFSNGQTLINRFRVPVTVHSSIAMGYDSNFLRLSERDIEETNPEKLGLSSTVDSPVIKPAVKLLYSPFLWKEHQSNFSTSVNYSSYTQSQQKKYSIAQFSAAVKMKPYSWIKAGYRVIPKYYLRKYRDRDVSITDYEICSFTSEKLYLSYSHPFPFIPKGWLQVTIDQTTEFYNPEFTEFDLRKITVTGDINFRAMKKSKVKLSFSHTRADNISFNSTLPSTNVDRSYIADKLKISYSGRVNGLPIVKSIGVSQSIEQRFYDLNSTHYRLDNWKHYIDGRTIFWMDWKSSYDFSIKTKCQYRWRHADSNIAGDFEWVEEVKSYQKFEFWVEIGYKFTWDGLY